MARDKKITFIRQKYFFSKEQDSLESISLNIKGKKTTLFVQVAFLRTAALPEAPRRKHCNASSYDDWVACSSSANCELF